MTASDVKRRYEKYCLLHGEEGHFFSRETMHFFGDTPANFGVRDGGKIKTWEDGIIAETEVWDLHRKRPVKGGLYGHLAYFRKDNGRLVYDHE